MSSYNVEEITKREDLDAIVDVIWAAMDGFDPSHQVFYPVFGGDVAAREMAIQTSKERMWREHKNDKSSSWIGIWDRVSGIIIGGCQWRIYEHNPFPSGTPKIDAVWWPEGEGRTFATEVVRQCYTPRTVWMARPHVGLSLMCVLPEYQRRGIGSLLMDWGLNRIDDLGLESFIEATNNGKYLYAKYGYRSVKDVNVSMAKSNASDEWTRLEKNLLPIGYTAMWRPVHGIWDEGEPQRTWDKRLNAA